MAKPLLDPTALAKIRADINAARDGLITDRILAIERAIDFVLVALERERS